MNKEIETSEKPQNTRSLFDYATEIIGWIQIVASPLLGGLIIGAMLYFSVPTTFRLVLAICIDATGFIAGVILATRAWKKRGTIHFISRVMASPELDNATNGHN